MIFGLFVISLLLFLGAFNYFLLSQKAGVYPPKQTLRRKAMGFVAIGGGVLLLTFILFLFSQ
ncbi:hypothetical protein [Litchfieldia alkalitelluris]|uniref:hypothetical protein n=1 Tax=Litchfieldia alkalitelluris TaxID=304268 RepID=UPI001F191C90|nr:hypothetical protein [Litchfieldia alkalitelluris]